MTEGTEERDRVSALIDGKLANRLRNTVDALSGPPERMRLKNALEQAIEAWCAKQEKAHNAGRAFPQRTGDLHEGRRV